LKININKEKREIEKLRMFDPFENKTEDSKKKKNLKDYFGESDNVEE
jgi:hypothetical protein